MAILQAMGLDGDIGTLTVDLGAQMPPPPPPPVSTVENFKDNTLTVVSTKYPFCANGETNSDQYIRSGATLVPFFQDLSRFQLVVLRERNRPAQYNYHVIWGDATNTYTSARNSPGRRKPGRRLCDQSILRNAFQRVDPEAVKRQAGLRNQANRGNLPRPVGHWQLGQGGRRNHRGRPRPACQGHRRRHDPRAPHDFNPSGAVNNEVKTNPKYAATS